MKITKRQLKQIIKEEVNDIRGSMLGGGQSWPPASAMPAASAFRKDEKYDPAFLEWANSLSPSPADPDFSISENVFNAFADVYKGDEAAAANETSRTFSHGRDLENHDHQQMLHYLAGSGDGGGETEVEGGWTPSGQNMADWLVSQVRTGEARRSNIENWEQKSLTGDWEGRRMRTGTLEHLTKQQLEQIIKEELQDVLQQEASMGAFARTDPDSDLVEESDMEEKAIRTAWELYGNDRGTKPDDPHPGGTDKEEAACTKRQKARQAKGRDPGNCD